MQLAALSWNQCDLLQVHVGKRCMARALQVGNPLAGHPIDLERALDALRIVAVNSRGGRRINLRQGSMNGVPAVGGRGGIDVGTNLHISLRQIRNAGGEGMEIEHRAADQQGQAATRPNILHRRECIADEFPGGILLSRIANINQMMGMAGAQQGGRLGRADIHAAVDERGIDADDLQWKTLDEPQREVGLAGPGRTHQEHGGTTHQRPREKSRSKSPSDKRTQVGRPWLHWSARSVTSISRSSAFISAMLKERCARTEEWQAMVASR